jgi:hypothetical protein
MLEKIIDRNADISGDLAKKRWRNIATGVERHGRRPTGSVAELLV